MLKWISQRFGFQRNAVLYLQSVSMNSLANGAFGVIQGLYIMSLGFDETVLGTILSARMLAAAISSIPAGILSDRIGRKPVLLAGGLCTTLGSLGMAVSSSPGLMIFFSCIFGLAQACQMTSGAPLLAEASSGKERARLFGVNFSLSMSVSMVGSLLGGYLPQRFEALGSVTAFKISLAVFSLVTMAGVIPATRIVEKRAVTLPEQTTVAGEIRALAETLTNRDVMNLLAYNLLIGLGAGLVIPFFNVFLSKKLGVDTTLVGFILSLSQGATAVAGLIAPVLAHRYGKVRTVVGTQIASIPFLLMIALPPSIYPVSVALFMRSALMNMSNPIASNFSMEIAQAERRGKISSLMRISDNISRALSAVIAGWMMSTWSYEIPYFFTAGLYLLASLVYYRAFRGRA